MGKAGNCWEVRVRLASINRRAYASNRRKTDVPASGGHFELEGFNMRRHRSLRSWEWLAVVLIAVLGLAVAGCTNLDGTDGTGVGGTTTVFGATTTEAGVTTTAPAVTTTLTPVSVVTPSTISTSEELLPNGHIRVCGIIKQVKESGGVRSLKIDYVEFLTGAPADAAALADGVIAAGEHVDNDYYVRNKYAKVYPYTVSNSAAITTFSRVDPIDVADPPCSWTTFRSFWGTPAPADEGLSAGLWWIERVGTTVVSIEQLWVP
jgi:hypothetical protein